MEKYYLDISFILYKETFRLCARGDTFNNIHTRLGPDLNYSKNHKL